MSRDSLTAPASEEMPPFSFASIMAVPQLIRESAFAMFAMRYDLGHYYEADGAYHLIEMVQRSAQRR